MIYLKGIILRIIRVIVALIPKKKNLWIFGAWQGKQYSDNSKYMFEYIREWHPEINAVWITKNIKVYDDLAEKNIECYMSNTVKGLLRIVRAEVAFETEGDGDLSPIISRTITIQLWHGLGIKAFKWNENGKPLFSKQKIKRYKQNYWMTTSELYNQTLKQLMSIPESHMFITGYPRNDTFIIKPKNVFMEHFIQEHPKKKIVIYMPTHRNFGQDSNSMASIQMFSSIDKLLDQNNIILFYKPHFHELKNFRECTETFKNIIIAIDDSIFADVYQYVHYFDLLISDYSTIAYEFICTGKPVVLFPYDIADYQKHDGGLLPAFWDYPVAPLAYSWEEVIDACCSLLENDNWAEKREKCREVWHTYNDGNNCTRVYLTVKEILNK